MDSFGSFGSFGFFALVCAKKFKCAQNRGENGPNLPVTARERCFAPRAAQRCQGMVGARIPLTGVQRRPSTSNGAPPPHRDAAAAGAADSRQAERRFVRGEGAATAAAVAAVAPPLTASLPSQGSPAQGPRSNRSSPCGRQPGRRLVRRRARMVCPSPDRHLMISPANSVAYHVAL